MQRPFLLLLTACLASSASEISTRRAPQGTGSAHAAHAPTRPSTSLSVMAGGKQVTLSLADLQAMPQTSVTVLNGHTNAQETYSGPLVRDVLAKAGYAAAPAAEHEILRSYVVATGTDGYFVVYSGTELQSTMHKAICIVAISRAGQPLTANGAFELIASLDLKPARWVRNLSELAVEVVHLPKS